MRQKLTMDDTRDRLIEAAHARAVLQAARAVLLDLDGTLIRTDEVIDGARDILDRFGDRAMILSNNSSDTEEGLSRRLTQSGLEVAPARIVLAGMEAVRLTASRWPGARVMMLASDPLIALARMLGLVVGDEAPEVVLVARTVAFDYTMLTRAANAVRSGAAFVVANPDLRHPGTGGRLVPETGALAAAISAASGRQPAHVFGKPQPELFQAALARLRLTPQDVVMIGDNPDTDEAGARRLGMPCILLNDRLSLRALIP